MDVVVLCVEEIRAEACESKQSLGNIPSGEGYIWYGLYCNEA
jgi:hypothetical protein